MGWMKTLLLGEWGNRMDVDANTRAMRSMRERLQTKGERDQDQDRELARVAEENDELKVWAAGLTRLLIQKGVLDEAEVAAYVEAIEDSGQR